VNILKLFRGVNLKTILAGNLDNFWREKLYVVFLLSEFSEEDEEEDDEVLKLDVETKTFSQDIQVRSPCLPPISRDAQVELCSFLYQIK
jgi:hypothetical protein